jgi:hypothetical protein
MVIAKGCASRVRCTGAGAAQLVLHVRRLVFGLLVAAFAAALTGCGSGKAGLSSASPAPTEVPQLADDVDAFRNNPNTSTWEKVHEDLVSGPLSQSTESRVVEALIEKDIEKRIVRATAIDLATSDWAGTMKWLRSYNIAAKTDTAQGPATIRRTAYLTWVMLSLRSSFSNDFVDLSGMDLRDNLPIVGQSMNLNNVDFSGGRLSPGIWSRSVLSNASFGSLQIDGPLVCRDCTWSSLHATATLVGDKFVIH